MPALGLGALVIAAVVGAVVSEFVPDDAPPLFVVVATVGGLVVGLVAEHILGRFLERQARRQAAQRAVEGLRARATTGLLSPRLEEQIVPFLGRKDLLNSLLDWCISSDRDPGPFHLITGPGGVGKTRLADELQRRLHKIDAEWESYFLVAEQGKEAGAVAALREHARDRPVLLVVDYAENRPGLRELLTEALDDKGTIRVLMLARTAGNWWDNITAISGSLGATLAASYDGTDLPDIDVDPQEILDAATAAYARHFGVATPGLPTNKAVGRLRVLDLTAKALATVVDSMERLARPTSERAARVERATAGEDFDELLRHEASYWAATARDSHIAGQLTIAMRQALVATVALLGAKDQSATVALAQRVLGTFTEDVHPDPVATAKWLRKAYTPFPAEKSGRWVESLTPDRVAEHLIVQVLTEHKHAVRRVNALLEDLTTTQAVQAMTVLSRAATDPARNEEQQETVRALADHLAEHLPTSPEIHAAVLTAVPSSSVRMAPTAALLARRHLDLIGNDHSNNEKVAAALFNLSFYLSEVGQLGEALPPAQRAVHAYELLAQSDRDRFEPDLAKSLSNLGARLWEVGRPSDGVQQTQRAVRIYERLARADPDRFEPDLAEALSNLGVSFSEMERPTDSLPHEQRAVRIYEQLARSNPDRFEPELARSLHNLAACLWKLGRSDDGLSVGQRAVQICELLARSNPDRFEPILARSLSNLGAWFADLGRPDDALAPAQRAIELRERLARSNPDRFEPGLARSLWNLGIWYSQLGRPGDGVALTQRAVHILNRLARSNPDRFEPRLAEALFDLGNRLSEVESTGDALSAWERASEVLQACHDRALPQVRHQLLAVLDHLASVQRELGHTDSAHEYQSRATALRRQVP